MHKKTLRALNALPCLCLKGEWAIGVGATDYQDTSVMRRLI